jgi:hypothetical protein
VRRNFASASASCLSRTHWQCIVASSSNLAAACPLIQRKFAEYLNRVDEKPAAYTPACMLMMSGAAGVAILNLSLLV